MHQSQVLSSPLLPLEQDLPFYTLDVSKRLNDITAFIRSPLFGMKVWVNNLFELSFFLLIALSDVRFGHHWVYKWVSHQTASIDELNAEFINNTP